MPPRFRFLVTLLALAASGPTAAQTPSLLTYCTTRLGPVRLCVYDLDGPASADTSFAVASIPLTARGRKRVIGATIGQSTTTLTISDLDGSNPEPFGHIPSSAQQMISLSPDYTRLAYIADRPGADGIGLYVHTPATDETTLLLTGAQGLARFVQSPKWSPDGQRLLFNVTEIPNTGQNVETIGLGTIPVDGSATYTRITSPSEVGLGTDGFVNDTNFDWSNTGDRVAFVRSQGHSQWIYTVPAGGGTAARIYTSSLPLIKGLEWSADDARLAILTKPTDPRSQGSEIYTMPPTGGTPSLVRTEIYGSAPTITEYFLEWAGSGSDALVVNDTGDGSDASDADGVCDADVGTAGEQCTLRAALEIAERTASRDVVSFDLPGDGPHTIAVSAALPVLTHPVEIDGATQRGYTGVPLVRLHGAGQGGLVLRGGDSVVRGLAVGGFAVGLTLDGGQESRVEGCYVGLAADGLTADPNGVGVLVEGAADAGIGGDEAEMANVISGNTGAGVVVRGEASTGAVVAGNRIGTSADGRAAVPNGAEGVWVDGAPGVQVGGSAEAERNLIAGNAAHGVRIEGAEAGGAHVVGNWIGLAADGTTALANGTDATERTGHHGVAVVSAPDVVIGGATGTPGRAPGNVIAASAAHQVFVTGTTDAPADGATVLGNLIGTDRTGMAARVGGAEAIVVAGAARSARIGEAGAGNVVVAGAEDATQGGVWLLDLGEAVGAPDQATVAANTIGMNAAGTAVLGRIAAGVAVLSDQDDGGVTGVSIGGDDAATGNRVVSSLGIAVFGPGSAGALVASNTVGLLASGALARTERSPLGIAVLLADGVQLVGNTVGGQLIGVLLASDDDVMLRNRIGTNPTASAARPNTLGVYVPGQLTDGPEVGDRTRIGGPGEGNVISGNEREGLRIGGDVSLGTLDNTRRRADAGRSWASRPGELRAALAAEVERGGLAAALARPASPRTAEARAARGAPDSVVIAFNRIGTDANGTRQLGNGRGPEDTASAGVWIRDGRGTRLLGNVISGNGAGVLVAADDDFGGDPRETEIAGSAIGAGAGTAATSVPNQHGGVLYIGSDGNRMTALPLETGGAPVGNVVRANGAVGVAVRPIGGERGNRIRSTSFFLNDGPSILLADADLDYPAGAAAAPTVLAAVQTDAGAELRLSVGVTGEADVFAGPRCDEGRAQGALIGTAAVSAGVLSVPVTSLPSGTSPLDVYLSATVTPSDPAGTTSEFSDCIRIARAADAATADVAAGETGLVLDDVGTAVTVTANGSGGGRTASRTGGTLYAVRYGPEAAPVPSALGTSATTPAGATLTPNTVATDRYWTLRADGLDGVTYDVCLDVGGVHGVQAPDQLLVLHRATPRQPWTAYDSSLDGGRLCAAGLSAWGDLALGADSLANPVPSEPAPADAPTALALSAPFPNPARSEQATVTVDLPEAGTVRLAVFDALGRQLAVALDGPLAAGRHAVPLDVGALTPGVYVVRLAVGGDARTQRLTVVR